MTVRQKERTTKSQKKKGRKKDRQRVAFERPKNIQKNNSIKKSKVETETGKKSLSLNFSST
jgi:hypothetical protein